MIKILVIGNAQHGKDTVAEMIRDIYGLTFKSSSIAASEIFLYDLLKDKYGYQSPEECFNDRVYHRVEWYNAICEYNKEDKARLAKAILAYNDMYIGMRSDEELEECLKQRLFDLVIGIYNPYKPLEPSTSFNIDMWKHSDIIIPNAGTLDELVQKVAKLPLYVNI